MIRTSYLRMDTLKSNKQEKERENDNVQPSEPDTGRCSQRVFVVTLTRVFVVEGVCRGE
jgi:hypothetical protein